jgi:hypothetical protein
MAKTKKHTSPKRKKISSVHKKKSKTMATKKKRKKSTSLSAPRRRSSLPVSVNTTIRRRRKKKGLLAASGSEIKANAIHNGAAMLGGAAYGIGSSFIPTSNPWIKAGLGAGLAFTLGMVNLPFLAAGAAGATGADLAKSLVSNLLHDGEMNDVEYVDPATLSDSGMMDENGNPIVMDADGMCYMQDGENSFQAIGDAYSLSEGMDIQSVSMIPLQDEYSLSANPYNLSAGY